MNQILNRDITIRIISVLIAIILWFVVLNTTNPLKTRDLNVPLKVMNEDKLQDRNLSLKNRNIASYVMITIRGRKEKIDNVNSGDFEVTLDFDRVKGVEDGEIDINDPVYIGEDYKNDIEIIGVKPKTMKLDLEKIIRKTFPVQLVETGTLPKGYIVVRHVVIPEEIAITEKESELKQVDSLKAIVDVSSIDRKTVNGRKEVKVYNGKGDEIVKPGMSFKVDVEIDIAKEVAVIPVIKGRPAGNYRQGEVKVTPEKVYITGTRELLSKTDSLKTEPVIIDNAHANVSITTPLSLPKGLEISGSSGEANVSIVIEQLIEREYTVKGSNIAITNQASDNSMDYTVVTDNAVLVFKATGEELATLGADNVKASIDVSGLKEGTHRLKLQVDHPAQIELVKSPEIEVKVTKKQADTGTN